MPTTPTRALTTQQQDFVDAMIAGESQSAAYRLAYNSSDMSPSAHRVQAFRLAHDPKIMRHVEEGRARVANRRDSAIVAREIASVEYIVSTTQRLLELAESPNGGKPQLAAAASLLGILVRLHPAVFAERVEIDATTRLQVEAMRSISSLSPGELRAFIASNDLPAGEQLASPQPSIIDATFTAGAAATSDDAGLR